jgi:hypothetical protein
MMTGVVVCGVFPFVQMDHILLHVILAYLYLSGTQAFDDKEPHHHVGILEVASTTALSPFKLFLALYR